ncbi:MAG: hypothetical protein AAGA54_18510 [Myxococcota bacterium]
MTDPDTRMARILTRAAAMQQARDDDVRLEALEEAAAEVGIDRALVRRAAWEQAVEATAPATSYGLPTRVAQRRWLDVDVSDPAVRGRLLARLDTVFGAQGKRTEEDGTATWSARHIVVTFEAEGGGTFVQISERFVNTASSMQGMGLTLGLGLGAMVAMGVLGVLGKGIAAAAVGPIIVMLMMAAGLAFGRRRVLHLLQAAERSFTEALDALEQVRPALGEQPRKIPLTSGERDSFKSSD